MILSKEQIYRISKLHRKAVVAELKARTAEQELCSAIVDVTEVDGRVDYLPGDGYGFTPESNLDTHIAIDILIELAKKGEDITENLIYEYLAL